MQLDLDDGDGLDVTVTPELDGNLVTEAEATRRAVRDAGRRQIEAAAESRKAARELKASGRKGADIAAIPRVSTPRVSQLLK